MNMNKFYFISAAFFFAIFAEVQNDSVTTALNQFAIKFLAETSRMTGGSMNIALSPFTVWNVMAIINEGARSQTAEQIENTLGIPRDGNDREQFRKLQQSLMGNIMKNDVGINLELFNAIFTRMENKLNKRYQQLIRKLYNVDISPLNFNDLSGARQHINKKLSDGTKGRLGDIVTEKDIATTIMFIMSAFFFKGAWDNKFDVTNTTQQPFYNENAEYVGDVKMMHHQAPFPYSLVLGDKATAVELPYKGKEMSLIILLPKPNVSLKSILDTLSETSFTTIADTLKQSIILYPSEEVKLSLPKFKIQTDFNLNQILHNMGIQDVFNANQADLSDISSDSLYVSRIIHKAEIEVDEEGTIATAATIAEVDYKMQPPVFEANRPFAFFVYDRQTQSIVFTGVHANPII